jgi:hypothetical protein
MQKIDKIYFVGTNPITEEKENCVNDWSSLMTLPLPATVFITVYADA